MSFQYSVIGDNTPENRDHLEKLGCDIVNRNDDRIILRTGYPKQNVAISYYDYHLPYLRSYTPTIIDCIGNDALFQAVTAMREDSDYMQWFVITRYNEAKEEFVEEWRLCKTDIFDVNSMPYYGIIASEKATLEELTEKFKSEKK